MRFLRSPLSVLFLLAMTGSVLAEDGKPDAEIRDVLTPAKYSSISGRVTAADTGEGVAHLSMTLRSSGGLLAATALTDAGGEFTFGGLLAGTFFIRASGSDDLLAGLFDGHPCPFFCDDTMGTPVTVGFATHLKGVDFALAPGGRISGTVTAAATGEPLDVRVLAFSPTGFLAGNAATTTDGRYDLRGLPPATYFVRTRNFLGYLDALHEGSPCDPSSCDPADGTPVEVSSGETAGIDFALTRGGRISGTLKDAATDEPVADVEVLAQDPSFRVVAGARSDSAGGYVLEGPLAGTYFVRTTGSAGFLGALYDGLLCPFDSCDVADGAGVSVEAGHETVGIDLVLTRGGTMSGQVTAADSGEPLRAVSVYLADPQLRIVGLTKTGTDGTYAADGLPAGEYFAYTSNDAGYLDEVFSDLPHDPPDLPLAAGTVIAVETGLETPGIDFALTRGGVLSGAVTAQSTGQPIGGMMVRLFDEQGDYADSVVSAVDGRYVSQGLRTGAYFAFVIPDRGFLGEIFGAGLCASFNCDATAGQAIDVVAGEETTDIDFSLDKGRTLSGRVVDEATGHPIPSAHILTVDATGSRFNAANTDKKGRYSVTGLAPDTYFVRTANSSPFLGEAYDGVSCALGDCDVTSGKPVVLEEEDEDDVDFALTWGGSLAGTVTELPIGWPTGRFVVIRAFDDTGSFARSDIADPNGAYQISGLPAGRYFLAAEAGLLLGQLYGGEPCVLDCDATAGSPVTVAHGETTPGIDFELTLGGRVSGRITRRDTGHPIDDVHLELFHEGSSPAFSVVLNSTGPGVGRSASTPSTYSVGALPAGTYFIRASAPGFSTVLFDALSCPDAACDVTAGDPVNVVAGESTLGIDFVLDVTSE